jgi:glycosyltransferase involved in cell wall biosynthesis
MSRTGVMHVIDTLEAGGAERVAVNLVNLLPRRRYQAYLCNTRRGGPLSNLVATDVGRLSLKRKWRFDWTALWHLIAFVKANNIQILHAHGTSVFIAGMASLFPPHPAIVWHDHFGRHLVQQRQTWLYRLVATRIGRVIAVSQALAEWSSRQLHIPASQVCYMPNFVCETLLDAKPVVLPGEVGSRIACVANLRSQKDHLNLIRAMALVIQRTPQAHLLLIGDAGDPTYLALIRGEITRQRLEHQVSILGHRDDVPAVLQSCDIGVLSSASEGFPLALMEYGMAKLPVVATRVGQCPEILDDGKAGVLVAAGSPEALSDALNVLLSSPERRATLGEHFHQRIQEVYSADTIVRRICQVYDSVLGHVRGE